MMRTITITMAITLMLCAAALPDPAVAQDSIDFQRQILPLLSDRCYTCHGPHEDSRQAGFAD